LQTMFATTEPACHNCLTLTRRDGKCGRAHPRRTRFASLSPQRYIVSGAKREEAGWAGSEQVWQFGGREGSRSALAQYCGGGRRNSSSPKSKIGAPGHRQFAASHLMLRARGRTSGLVGISGRHQLQHRRRRKASPVARRRRRMSRWSLPRHSRGDRAQRQHRAAGRVHSHTARRSATRDGGPPVQDCSILYLKTKVLAPSQYRQPRSTALCHHASAAQGLSCAAHAL
jgi:hypothetical protein